MDISELTRVQREFDNKHGWSSESKDAVEQVKIASSDIIGLIGEIGELANLIKKANLLMGHQEDLEKYIKDNEDCISEEFIDGFIYMMRLAVLFDIDIEKEYFKKLSYNDKRFKKFEK